MGQKKQINARVPDQVFDAIGKRASLLQESHGGYLTLLAQWWFAQGQPAVSDFEARVLDNEKKEKPAKRAS